MSVGISYILDFLSKANWTQQQNHFLSISQNESVLLSFTIKESQSPLLCLCGLSFLSTPLVPQPGFKGPIAPLSHRVAHSLLRGQIAYLRVLQTGMTVLRESQHEHWAEKQARLIWRQAVFQGDFQWSRAHLTLKGKAVSWGRWEGLLLPLLLVPMKSTLLATWRWCNLFTLGTQYSKWGKMIRSGEKWQTF